MRIHFDIVPKVGDDVPDDEGETVVASELSDGDGRILAGTVTSLGDGLLATALTTAGDKTANRSFRVALSMGAGGTRSVLAGTTVGWASCDACSSLLTLHAKKSK